MADSYKGLIIRIGGDTSGLMQALKASDKAINATQKQLRQLEKASKLDSAGASAVNERLDLMGDKAQALTTKLRAMNRTLEKMDGSEIRKLSASTEDAAYNAQKLTARYAAVVDKIKALKNQIASATLGDAFSANDKATDPFTRLNSEGKNLLGTVAQVKAKIRELNGVSADGLNDTAQVRQQIAAYEKLVAEFRKVSEAKKQAAQAAEFKDMQVQMAATKAEARSLYQQMARLAAENPAATQTAAYRNLAEKLSSLGTEAARLKTRLAGLDEALELDPKNIEVARARLQTLAQAVQLNQTRMAALRSELKQLDTADGSISRLASEGRNLASELYAANNRVAQLSQRIDSLKAVSAVNDQTADVKRLESALAEAKARASQLSSAMRYSSTNAELQTLSAQTNALSSSMTGAVTKSSQWRGVLQNLGWTLTATLSPAALMFGRYAVDSANEVDSAYRDMRKTVQGTERQFESLKQAALDYSRTHVTSADTILEIEAMGGQLGVATSKLESFATVVSNLDIATDLDADTAAEQLGQLSGILNDMSDNDFAKYGDALTRLGNNNSTLESKISDVMLRISSMGTITGFTTPQLLAWSTAVASTGQGCEAAGTAISKTMSDIESAVGAGGDKLENFASVAGMSATEFANKWKSDPSAAMQSFIEGLKRVEEEGGSADNTLASLGITSVRQKQAILGLTQTIDALSDNLTMSQDAWDGVGDQWGDAGDAAREAERKAEGFSGAVQLLLNNAQALGVEMATGLSPIIQRLAAVVAAATATYSGASGGMKTFAAGLLAVVAAGGSLTVLVSGLLNFKNALETTLAASKSMKAAAAGMEIAAEAATELKAALSLAAEAYLANGTASEKAAAKELLAAEASGVATTATKVLSSALKTLPWVAVAAGAAYLATQLYDVYQKEQTAKEAVAAIDGALATAKSGFSGVGDAAKLSTSEIVESAQKATSATKDLGESLQSSFSELGTNEATLSTYLGTIERLAGNCDGSAASVWELKNAVDGYNEITGESLSVINSQTGELSKSTEEVKKLAEAWKLNAELKGYQEAYSEVVKQRAANEFELGKVESELSDKQAALAETTKALEAAGSDANAGLTEEGRAVSSLTDEQSRLRSENDSLSESAEFYLQKVNELAAKQKKQTQSTSEAASAADLYAAALGKTSDEFSELVTETTSAVEGSEGLQSLFEQTGLSAEEFAFALSSAGTSASDLASGIESMASKVQNAFDAIKEAESVSLDQMVETLQNNIDVTNNWSSNLQELYAKAGDGAGKSLVDAIAAKGPEYAQTVAGLLDADDEQLAELVAKWQEAGESSVTAAAVSMGASKDSLVGTARQVAAECSGAFNQSFDGAQAGTEAVSSVAQGMQEGFGAAAESTSASASELKQAALTGMSLTPEEVMSATSGIPEGLTQSLGSVDAYSIGQGEGTDFGSGVESTSGDVASKTATVADASEDEIKQKQQTAWHIGASVGSNYAVGIWSKTGEAASAGGDVASSAASELGGYGDTAWQWGAHMGSNFAAGLWSKTGEASEASAAVAAAAAANLKHTIARKGPLHNGGRGEKPWGAHLVKNFVSGMASQESALSSASARLAGIAAQALSAGSYQNGIARAVRAAGASTVNVVQQAAPSAAEASQMTVNISVDATGGNAQEIAQAVRSEIADLCRKRGM